MLQCARCQNDGALYLAEDQLLCRACYFAWSGRQPPAAALDFRVHLKQAGFGSHSDVSKEGPRDGPWGSLWPELIRDTAASPSASNSVNSVASAFAAAADAGAEFPTVGLWDLAGECAAWLHARTMIAVAQVLLRPGLPACQLALGLDLAELLLRSLAKDAQPCHSSEWVAMAGELQLIGLAHGDAALAKRSAEAAGLIRATRDAAAAAELLWVFLTAKALDKELLAALESVDLAHPLCTASAASAMLCGLAQPAVAKLLEVGRLLRLASRLAEHVCSNVDDLPTISLPRVALALSDLLEVGQKDPKLGGHLLPALCAVGSKAVLRVQELSVEDLADLAVASSRGGHPEPLDGFAQEAGRRLQGQASHSTAIPGAAVILDRAVGPVHAGSTGLLGEYCLATGRWRVWLDGGFASEREGVDVLEQDFKLLHGGARPQRCCYECWRLSPQLWRSHTDSSSFLALNCFCVASGQGW